MNNEIRQFKTASIPQKSIDGDLGYDEEGVKILNLTEMQEAIEQGSAYNTPKLYGYKSFRGAVRQLKRLNDMCKKKDIKLRFTIDLPLKD